MVSVGEFSINLIFNDEIHRLADTKKLGTTNTLYAPQGGCDYFEIFWPDIFYASSLKSGLVSKLTESCMVTK